MTALRSSGLPAAYETTENENAALAVAGLRSAAAVDYWYRYEKEWDAI